MLLQIILEIATVLLYFIAIMQRSKWQMMVVFTVENAVSAGMYFVCNRYASACLCMVAFLRTIIYAIYSYKQIKPNLFWVILFEVGFIVGAVFTWQDAYDLLPLFAMLAVGYGSWQDNMLVLRASYIINTVLYIAYKAIIGTYIAMASSVVQLVFTIITLVYYCVHKKRVPIFQLLFRRKQLQNVEVQQTVNAPQETEIKKEEK